MPTPSKKGKLLHGEFWDLQKGSNPSKFQEKLEFAQEES